MLIATPPPGAATPAGLPAAVCLGSRHSPRLTIPRIKELPVLQQVAVGIVFQRGGGGWRGAAGVALVGPVDGSVGVGFGGGGKGVAFAGGRRGAK